MGIKHSSGWAMEGGYQVSYKRDRPEIPHLFDRVTLVMMKVNKVEKGKIWNDKKEEEEGGKNLCTDAATSIVHPVALSCHTNSDGYTSAAYLGRICHLEKSAFYWHHLLLLDLFHHLVPYLVPPLSHYATNSFLALTPLFVIGWLRRSSWLPATYSNDCVYNSSSSVQPSGVARKKQIAPGCNSPEIWLCCRAFISILFTRRRQQQWKEKRKKKKKKELLVIVHLTIFSLLD